MKLKYNEDYIISLAEGGMKFKALEGYLVCENLFETYKGDLYDEALAYFESLLPSKLKLAVKKAIKQLITQLNYEFDYLDVYLREVECVDPEELEEGGDCDLTVLSYTNGEVAVVTMHYEKYKTEIEELLKGKDYIVKVYTIDDYIEAAERTQSVAIFR